MNQDWLVEMEINSKYFRQKRQVISSHPWVIWVQAGLWNWVQALNDIGALFSILHLGLGELALFSPTAKNLSLRESKDSPWIILVWIQNAKASFSFEL